MMCVAASKWTAETVLTIARAMLWVSRTSAELFPDNVAFQIMFNFVAYGLPLLVLDAFVFPTKKQTHTMFIVVDNDLTIFANVTDMTKFITNQLSNAFGDYANDTASNTALALWMKQDPSTLDHIERGNNDVLKRVYVVKKLPTNHAFGFEVLEDTNEYAFKGTLFEMTREFKYKMPSATAVPEWKQEAVHVLKRVTT